MMEYPKNLYGHMGQEKPGEITMQTEAHLLFKKTNDEIEIGIYELKEVKKLKLTLAE
jgi:hypothetical protein